MGDFSGVAAPQAPNSAHFNKSQAFAAALQRAKQIAAKINPVGANSDSGTKRPLDDGQEPDSKKLAAAGLVGRPAPGIVNVSGLPLGPVSSEDIKVPDKMVGLIIGRGGEQITRLQSESGCKIQMAPDSGGAPERTCTLTGNANAIGRAKELINAIVHQRFKTEGPAPRGMEELVNTPQNIPNNPSFVEVMIPGPKVGLVIGKGGETIKQLQEKSGAKMVVIQDGPNQEAEKPLRITGDPHKVDIAKNLVYELLAEKEAQMSRGGFQGGRQGGGGGGGGVGGGGGGGGGPGNPRFNRNSGSEESTFVVPAAKCGVVIGRGGETIKQINQATGAHCELDRRPGSNPTEKTFVIRGTPEQIEAAKQMISEKLGQGPTGPPGMGGGMGGQPGGPGGYNPQYPGWGPPAQQPQPGAPYHQPYQPHIPTDPSGVNQMGGGAGGGGGGGQPDYSQQWIEYYRSVGMHSEADAVEQQMKAKAAAAVVAAGGPGGQGGGPAGAGAAPPHNGQPDYSAQWAQYYRSIGKIKEAEMIEQQMKSKGVGGPGGGGGAPGGPGGAGGGPGMPGGGGYPGAPGGYPGSGYPGGPAAPFYPGAPQAAPYYPGAPYPGAVPYGAPAQPSQQPPPPSDQPPQQSNQPSQS